MAVRGKGIFIIILNRHKIAALRQIEKVFYAHTLKINIVPYSVYYSWNQWIAYLQHYQCMLQLHANVDLSLILSKTYSECW